MPDNPRPVLEKLPVSEVWGVGGRLTAKLEKIGLRTAWQLACADTGDIRKRFSVILAKTVMELRGESVIEHEDPDALSQSISHSRTFGKPVTEFDEMVESVCTYTARAAEKLRKELQMSFAIARRENVGAFFGSDKRYLFDAHCCQAATNVSIGGWVKWGYSDGEFTDMFRWLKSKANIKKFRMAYEELMTDQYGEYELHADGTMWNNFLLEKDFPAAMDDFEAYCEKVEEAFRKNPATRLIKVD